MDACDVDTALKPPTGMRPANPPDGELSPGDDSNAPEPAGSASGAALGTSKQRSAVSIDGLSIAAVTFGAALGALLRWYLATLLNARFSNLPPGTLAANIIGGYLIGIGMAVFNAYPKLSPKWRLLTITGFLGGLTTFSSFSAEVAIAILSGRDPWAVCIVCAHVIGSIAMTLLGIGTVRLLRRRSQPG